MPVEKTKDGYHWGKTGKIYPTKNKLKNKAKLLFCLKRKRNLEILADDKI